MNEIDYPALYRSADSSAAKSQSSYLFCLKLQYFLLIFSAVLVLLFFSGKLAVLLYVITLIVSTGILIYMANRKPERDWYSCRALAESVKTASWRYMMRAEPFENSNNIAVVRQRFAEFLNDIVQANEHTKEAISHNPVAGDQITQKMTEARALTLFQRKEKYRHERIVDQKDWYVRKTKENRKYFKLWVGVCIALQMTAIIFAITSLIYPILWKFFPIEALLVSASAVLGWIQIKKFNELASAYSLTAHEIGIVESKLQDIDSDDSFSDFVNEAEQAFSREHTQWVARQTEHPF